MRWSHSGKDTRALLLISRIRKVMPNVDMYDYLKLVLVVNMACNVLLPLSRNY